MKNKELDEKIGNAVKGRDETIRQQADELKLREAIIGKAGLYREELRDRIIALKSEIIERCETIIQLQSQARQDNEAAETRDKSLKLFHVFFIIIMLSSFFSVITHIRSDKKVRVLHTKIQRLEDERASDREYMLEIVEMLNQTAADTNRLTFIEFGDNVLGVSLPAGKKLSACVECHFGGRR